MKNYKFLMSACSSQPTLAEQMLQQSNSAAHFAEQWEQGRDALARGEKLRKRGKAQIEEAHDAMQEGENNVSEPKKIS